MTQIVWNFMEIQIPPEHCLLGSFQGGQKLRSFGHNHTESTFIEETKNYVEKWKKVYYIKCQVYYISPAMLNDGKRTRGKL